MKLYIIIVAELTRQGQHAMKRFLRHYRSKLSLGPNCWLVTTSGTSAKLCQEIEQVLGAEFPVIVSQWNGGSAWARKNEILAEWLPRRLASISN